MIVYVTGPAYTPYARRYLNDVAETLQAHGFEIILSFTPQQDAIDAGKSLPNNEIFNRRFEGIARSHALLALMDGSQADDGVSLEIGLYHALMFNDPGKVGVIGLMTDWRGIERKKHGCGVNLLTLGAIEEVGMMVTSLDEAVVQLQDWL